MRTLVLSLACALALLLLPAAASAQTPEERARILYTAGKDHYDHGRYEAAAAEFEAAYALSPRPELRYNLYLAYERLGRFQNALEHLEVYLAEGDIADDERGRLQARRDALRERAGRPMPPPPPPERPRRGFRARVALGLGYAGASNEFYDASGSTGDVMVLVGWRFLDRLAVHATLWGGSLVNPTIEGKGLLAAFVFKDNATYTAAALGAGVTFDLPSRFYLTGTVGAGRIAADSENAREASNTGLALLAGAGKDWSIGGGFALGVVASVSLLSIEERITDRDVRTSVVLLSVLGSVVFD